MAVGIEWVDEPPRVLGRVGQLSPTAPTVSSEAVTVEAAEQVERKFSTEEKLLIASLLVNIVSISWQAFQWRKENK